MRTYDASYFLNKFLFEFKYHIAYLKKASNINQHLIMEKAKSDYIGIQLERATINAFKKLCESKGSNMSVEIKRYIYKELKEAGK